MARTRERFCLYLNRILGCDAFSSKSLHLYDTMYRAIRDTYEADEGRKTAAEFMQDLMDALEAERT